MVVRVYQYEEKIPDGVRGVLASVGIVLLIIKKEFSCLLPECTPRWCYTPLGTAAPAECALLHATVS